MEPQPIIPPPRPKNWLVESILVTIFCCLPFGVVGIVFASQVNAKYDTGDFDGAIKASQEASKWTRIGFWIGIIWVICWLLWIFFWGGLAIFNANYNF